MINRRTFGKLTAASLTCAIIPISKGRCFVVHEGQTATLPKGNWDKVVVKERAKLTAHEDASIGLLVLGLGATFQAKTEHDKRVTVEIAETRPLFGTMPGTLKSPSTDGWVSALATYKLS